MIDLITFRDQLRGMLALVEAEIAQPTAAPAGASGPLAWGAKVSPVFRDRVRWIGDTLKFDPNWLMACMGFETGRRFTADIKNPGSSATGLIQFMDATAAELNTTTARLAGMTAEDQLRFVFRYFEARIRAKGPIVRLADAYMAILNPVAMGQPDSFVMWVAGGRAYTVNAGLDTDKDHQITKAEAAAHVAQMLAEGLKPGNAA